MKSPSSAKAMMAGIRASMSSSRMPSSEQLRRMFSRPVNCWWNPSPRSSSVLRLARTSRWPSLGRVMPPMILRRVDLPAPFGPMTPKLRPRRTENDTSFSAQWGVWWDRFPKNS
jgi:hypothetical protein